MKMEDRRWKINRGALCALSIIFLFIGCQKKKNIHHTSLTLPRGSYDVLKMANGATVEASVKVLQNTNSALTAASFPEAYALQLTLHLAIPTPATTMEELCAATPELPAALPALKSMLPEPSANQERKASPFYTILFNHKIKTLEAQLAHLGQLPSRDTLYDCQTILALTNKETQANALLVQAIMNVNADGSDGDRNIPLEKLSSCYQPQTNYRWPKASPHPNPNVTDIEAQVALWKQELLNPAITPEQKNKLEQQIAQAATTLEELKRWSFLIGSADPFIVLPKFMFDKKEHGLEIGDYAIVLYQGILYPAIVGDIGPSSKIGEASLRLCRAIDPRSGADHRPVSSPHVSYFLFPKSGEKPWKTPDYPHWRERCYELWKNLGGNTTFPWHEWTKIEQE
ncbi:MAG: glycoside hydrolase family 75 protein [Chthoniobacterales bacterium]|nr:glycoside hydrolase family 75 protein [Chthoniobacterales bacterium]